MTATPRLLDILGNVRQSGCNETVDSGCGPLVPIRASSLARIDVFHYSIPCTTRLAEKHFTGHAINYTVRGSWQYRYGGRWHQLASGDVNVIGSGEEYGCAHDRQHANSSVFLQLLPGALDPDAIALFSRPTLRVDIGAHILRAAAASDEEEFDSQMFELFDAVSQWSRTANERTGAGRVRVQRLKRFIECHYRETLTLAQIAQSVHVSPFTALRQFKAATGYTPNEYVARLRIRHAQYLLADPRIPVSEVSGRSGFATHPHFSRTFRSYTGTTPTNYRRLALRT